MGTSLFLAVSVVVITSNNVGIHERPDHDAPLIARAELGTQLLVDEQKRSWFKVRFTFEPDSEEVTGWVRATDVRTRNRYGFTKASAHPAPVTRSESEVHGVKVRITTATRATVRLEWTGEIPKYRAFVLRAKDDRPPRLVVDFLTSAGKPSVTLPVHSPVTLPTVHRLSSHSDPMTRVEFELAEGVELGAVDEENDVLILRLRQKL